MQKGNMILLGREKQKRLFEFKPKQSIKITHTCKSCSGVEIQEIPAVDKWDVINEQIDRSKISRINWRAVFGESLTKAICRKYAEGYSSNEALFLLGSELRKRGIFELEIHKKLRISVCSRFAEIRSESKMIKSVRDAQVY